MGDNNIDYNNMERVNAEVDRLWKLLDGIDDNKRGMAKRLVENSAFMAVTLSDLQETITRDGVTEKYQNGSNQYGIKKSAAVEVYNTLIKNFTVVNKQLIDLAPEAAGVVDELLEFIKRN